MSKILVLGTGAWATALGDILLENKKEVYFYGIDKNEIKDLNNQLNTKYFGNKKLSKKPNLVSNEIEELFKNDFDFILLAVPSFAIKNVLQKIKKFIKNKPIFINAAKGLDQNTNKPLSFTIKKELNSKYPLTTLIGPSFAKEVFFGATTIINIVSADLMSATKVSNIFNNSHFKCVELQDEDGAQFCAALKNVMAIACGITYQLHTSINTRSAILAQATKEIFLLIKKQSGSLETIIQFCGIGDIFLTCSDEKSRNFSFGKEVAIHGAKKAISFNNQTVEGYKTLDIAQKLVDKYKINAPVIKNLYKVIYQNKDPKNFVSNITKEIIK